MQMQSLRRFRKFVVLAALVWLPMSVFAQICATHAQVSHLGGPRQPALIASDDTSVADAARMQLPPTLAVVDAATFWQPVDDCDSCCDMKSMCAFASLSALVASTTDLTFAHDTPVPQISDIAFSTRVLSPDTPPPRR